MVDVEVGDRNFAEFTKPVITLAYTWLDQNQPTLQLMQTRPLISETAV